MSETSTIAARQVLTPGGLVGPAEVTVADGRIVAVRATTGTVEDAIVAPGFVDLQVNGVDDVDVATARDGDWDRLDGLLAATGTTAWLPTLVTAPADRYAAPLGRIAAARDRGGHRPAVLGAHLEGPWLGGCLGAHAPAHVTDADLAWFDGLPAAVVLVTLGPERRGALDAIAALRARGVLVSLGHSAAGPDCVDGAVAAGATMVTHLFNAMGPLHHRAPGMAGAALADDRLVAGLIADLVHVDPVLLTVALRTKGSGRIALVTDAVAWRAPHLIDLGITVVDGAPRLADGTIAGSALTMDAAVRNLVDHTGATVADALVAASTTPARALGDATRGCLEIGRRADLVVLGAEDLAVRRTVVGGTVIHEA